MSFPHLPPTPRCGLPPCRSLRHLPGDDSLPALVDVDVLDDDPLCSARAKALERQQTLLKVAIMRAVAPASPVAWMFARSCSSPLTLAR